MGQEAKEKLKKSLEAVKDVVSRQILEYLIRKCDSDTEFAAQVLQEGKSWKKCHEHIFNAAKAEAGGAQSYYVENNVVYQWAENYYKMSPEEERKIEERKKPKKYRQLNLFEMV